MHNIAQVGSTGSPAHYHTGTAFPTPDALPYPWYQLPPPGKEMTEESLLDILCDILPPLSDMLHSPDRART